MVFQFGGEVVVHILEEVLGQEFADHPSGIGGDEALAVHFDVFALLQGGDDAGVGGGATNAEFFQGAHQRGFGITWRRFGEVLFGPHGQQRYALADMQRGELFFVRRFLFAGVVAIFSVDDHEAGFEYGGAVGA